MKILLDIGHPAHVHLFKNFIKGMETRGHEFLITARDKEVSLYLLDKYGFAYHNRGRGYSGLFNKALGMLAIDYNILSHAKKFKPDILVGGTGNLYIAQVAKLIGKPSIIFDDTEHATFQLAWVKALATTICTPSCYQKNLGKKQVRYNGYHELAYLHPRYFTPDSAVLDELNLSKDEPFFVVRFVSWGASHDIGHSGLGFNDQVALVKLLEQIGRVVITSEGRLPKQFERYRLSVKPEKIHDLLASSALYVGEGATMASEAACLGVPAIYANTLPLGYLNEQAGYGLVYNIPKPEEVLEKIPELLSNNNLGRESSIKRNKLLSEKVDVTAWMSDFIGEKMYETTK